MSIKQKGKKAKRIIVARLTSNSVRQQKGPIEKVLISRPNHRLGNLLLITPLIQEVTQRFPDCSIDLFVSGHHAPTLFKEYHNIDRIISLPRKPGKDILAYARSWWALRNRKYDLVINSVTGSSSGRLAAVFAKAPLKFVTEDNEEVILKEHKDGMHFAKFPVYSFRRFLKSLGMQVADTPVPLLDLKLTSAELETGKKLLYKIVPASKPVISIFTNATGSKCLPEIWWLEFYQKLKKALPTFEIMEVLPVENTSKIGFQAPSYYSKDTREMGSVIANTAVFISADNGVMHLASASKTPTLGLFSQGRIEIYQPYGNGSTAVDTNELSPEEIIAVLKGLLFQPGEEMLP